MLLLQAEEYQSVLRECGEEYLLEYQGEALSWEEVKALTGGDAVGLPIGYDAAAAQEQGAARCFAQLALEQCSCCACQVLEMSLPSCA